MKFPLALVVAAASLLPNAQADVITGVPDAAPAGYEQWVSPLVLPAKNVTGDGGWAAAVAKAKQFVAQLTLDEKVNITTGAGTNGRCVGNTGSVLRLGFKGFCLEDSPLGVRDTDGASAFPAGINVATTWDKTLFYDRGAAMGAEHRGKGVNMALGPMTNLGRVAAGGRNWEGFGADPFLAGVVTAQTVDGMQSAGVIATVKHYVGNEQEHFRGGSEATQIYSSDIDDRTIHELYTWPFAEAVNIGVGAVMCSYNKINQTQACQNSKVLNGILKEELDFQGFIMSDWAAMIDGVQPALAGLDMNMPGFIKYGLPSEGNPDNTTDSWWGSALIEAVNNGSVPEWRVDDMVIRSMSAYYKMGQDNNYPDVNFDYNSEATYIDGVKVNEHVNVQGNHYQVIREIGGASTILLKNTNNALPLNVKNIKRIAIIGEDAGPNPDGPNGCTDRGCDQGTLAMGWGSGTANFPYLIDPLSALQNYIHNANPTIQIEGILDDYNKASITTSASLADVCLVFVNADSGEGYITVDGNAGDRTNLTLWKGGEAMINLTASVCENTIVVQHVVGPILVESWIEHPNVTAVLHAGLPGQESGNAIVDVIFGAVNPSARLPYTIAKQRSDYPADVLYTSNMTTPQIVYEEALNIDYRHFDANNIEPRFEFGFGLSYTSFEYKGLDIVGGEVGAAKTKRDADGRRQSTTSSSSSTSGHQSTTSSTSTAHTSSLTSHTVTSTAHTSSSTAVNGTSSASSTATGNNTSTSATVTTTGNATSTSASSNSTTATSTGSAPPVVSSPAQTNPGGPANLFDTAYSVLFGVTNTGKVAGNEVPQLYLGFPEASGEPPKVLRGFERILLNPGETQTVNIPLRIKDISIWDVVQQKWVVPAGQFTVYVGSSSRIIHLTGHFTPA